MKKLGIVTIIDNNNYGNRLQNYATQTILNKMGIENNTILNTVTFNTKKRYLLKKLKYFNQDLYCTDSKNFGRKNAFDQFNQNISFDNKKYTIYSKFHYEWLLVGSDQVWNPFLGRLNDMDLLNIKNVKKIALSASFGINALPESINKEKISKCLNEFKGISVRETEGKQILTQIGLEKDIQVLVDPTLLLTDDEWDKVAKKPPMLRSKKYILNYFLGNLSEERKKEIDRIAQENDCEVINILDKNSEFYECGPSEFLYLEKHAFLVCTDSFHSSVFAIIYNRPFIVFDREEKGLISMSSRLNTLISKLKLQNREYNGKSITDLNLNHDYSSAYEQLKYERAKAIEFISNTIRGEIHEI